MNDPRDELTLVLEALDDLTAMRETEKDSLKLASRIVGTIRSVLSVPQAPLTEEQAMLIVNRAVDKCHSMDGAAAYAIREAERFHNIGA